MEPEERYYEPFIKPLLDRNGSAYRHTTLPGAHPNSYWDNYREVLEDTALLPPRPQLASDDPRRREFDPSLLVIGNLWRRYKVRSLSRVLNYAPLVLQHMTYGALTESTFQGSGLVRMLWWVPEACKLEVFAESVMQRSSFNVGLDMGAKVTEVAGVTPVASMLRPKGRADDGYKAAGATSQRNAEEAMRSSGMTLPSDREQLSTNEPNVNAVPERPSPLVARHYDLSELENAIQTAQRRLRLVVAIARLGTIRKPASELQEAFASLEYPECAERVNFRRAGGSMAVKSEYMERKVTVLFDLNLRLVNIEASLKDLEDQGIDKEALSQAKENVLQLDGELQEEFEDLGDMYQDMLNILIDTTISSHLSQPIVPADSKAYKPFAIEDHEVWPKYGIMLLDIVPKGRDLSVPDLADRKEGTRVCQELLKYLFGHRAKPVTWALDRIAPNAAQDLIPQVPAITDPRKGGRLNPDRMRVRMLSEQMVEGLVKAFVEWPFRPESWQLALAGGEMEGSESAEDDVVDPPGINA